MPSAFLSRIENLRRFFFFFGRQQVYPSAPLCAMMTSLFSTSLFAVSQRYSVNNSFDYSYAILWDDLKVHLDHDKLNSMVVKTSFYFSF